MIVGVSMVKDEADIIGWTIYHLAKQGVDRFVIADNMSTDATRDILERSRLTDITVVDDIDPAHYQGRKITALVREHCTDGDWVVPFDADEMWTAARDGTLAHVLHTTDADVVRAQVWDYLPQPDDPNDLDPYRRTGWRELTPEQLPVVAFRYHPFAVVHEGNHGVDHPGRVGEGLKVRHLQYRSFEQFCRKLRNGRRALEATNLPTSTGSHWREWGALDDETLRGYWERLTGQELVYDPL